MQRIKLCCFNQCWCKFSVEPYLCINKTLICAEAYDSQVLIDLELQKLNTSSEPCLSLEFEKKKWIFHLFVDEIHLFDHASYMHKTLYRYEEGGGNWFALEQDILGPTHSGTER